ncbi:hypothetical protein CDL15_Pgr012770 [Punica granatum]|uniref:Uncharacterized protein n=1 Tax=Punica granatum TaxID=22663 RepID=A0A218XF20_PUNGR|nr:hypothetical protein CDL15_Pgr012770 [Punica granatum]
MILILGKDQSPREEVATELIVLNLEPLEAPASSDGVGQRTIEEVGVEAEAYETISSTNPIRESHNEPIL